MNPSLRLRVFVSALALLTACSSSSDAGKAVDPDKGAAEKYLAIRTRPTM